ncbi:MAG: TonB-dependent receptor family protein, partial [Myxococcota bacterium]
DGGVPRDAAGPDTGVAPAGPDAGPADAAPPSDGGAPDGAPPTADPGEPPEPAPAPEPVPPGDLELDAEDLELDADDPDLAPSEEDVAPVFEDDETFELDELAITASPEEWFRTGGAVTRIDEEILETFEQDNPNSVLLQAPGVYVRSEDGYGLRPNIGIRGASPERSKKITLMEDGVLFAPAPYAAPAAYFFPLMTRMVGVDVFKGPSSIKYGPHTVGGAIDLSTREVPDEPGGAVDLALGNYYYRKAHLHYGARNEWGGILFEGVYLGTDGYKTIDLADDDTGFDKYEGMLKAFVHTDLDRRVYHRVDFKLEGSREVSDETYLGLTDGDFAQDPNRRYAASQRDRMEWWRTLAQVRYTLGVGADFELVTTLYRQDFDRSWRKLNRFEAEKSGDPSESLLGILRNPQGTSEREFYEVLTGQRDTLSNRERLLVGTNARRFVSEGIQTVARYGFQTGEAVHKLEAGLRFHHDQIDRDHTERPFAMTNGSLVPVGDDDSVLDNFGLAHAFAGHLAYGVTWKGLTLTPGFRTEVIRTELRQGGSSTEATRVAPLAGLGAHYALTDDLGVLAGVHMGFSPVAPGTDEAIEPEKSVNYEAGVRYVRPGGTLLEAIGFVSDYSNLLGTCTFSGSCPADRIGQQFNLGAVLVYGAEAAAAHRFELEDAGLAFPLRAAYTITASRFDNDLLSADPLYGDVKEGDPLPYVPMHQLSLRAGVEMDAWGVNLLGTYVGAMEEQASETGLLGQAQTDAYFMLDAEAHYRVVEDGKLYVQLRNVTGTAPIVSRRPFGARPINPFLLMAGYKHEL